uniref:Uncharacterized protein n=1 Tax=viral metagenome TaxID=1070528 RepID=A0A6C0BD10_9ZZZZ
MESITHKIQQFELKDLAYIIPASIFTVYIISQVVSVIPKKFLLTLGLRLFKFYKSLSSKDKKDKKDFFIFDYEKQKFGFQGTLEGKHIIVYPDQFTIPRSVSLILNDQELLSITNVEFTGKTDFDCSTTFVFTSNFVQFQKETTLKIICHTLGDQVLLKYQKGHIMNFIKEVREKL